MQLYRHAKTKLGIKKHLPLPLATDDLCTGSIFIFTSTWLGVASLGSSSTFGSSETRCPGIDKSETEIAEYTAQ